MLRLKEHVARLNQILNDDRLSPNRRFLGELLCLYFDADRRRTKPNGRTVDYSSPFDEVAAAAEKQFMKNIIIAQFGNPRNIQWLDSQDESDGRSLEQIDADTGNKLRNIYDKLLPEAKKE